MIQNGVYPMRGVNYLLPTFKASRQMMYFNGYSVHILDFKQGDVNGDGIMDSIYLVGDRPYGLQSSFAENIAIVVQDGRSYNYNIIALKENIGYNPTIFLGDFTGDKIDNILVSIDSGGSGGYLYSYVYSFLNNIPQKLFDFERFNEQYKYDVEYLYDYKVKIISDSLNKKYTLDIKYKGLEYLSKIYDKKGNLNGATLGDVSALVGLYPIDFERDGIYELNALQRIVGRFNADTLGFVETTLKWNSEKFVPLRQYVLILGSEIGD